MLLLLLLLLLLYVGIYNEASVSLEVEEMEPELSVLKETIDSMRHAGVKVSEGERGREQPREWESEEKERKLEMTITQWQELGENSLL